MIKSPEEFRKLRLSDNLEEQSRSVLEPAELQTWFKVIEKYPDLKKWVAHNKTIQIEVLEHLAKDKDVGVRCVVARKRKINHQIFDSLKADKDETVRHALICNTKLPIDLKKQIKVDDSEWLKEELNGKIKTGANNI